MKDIEKSKQFYHDLFGLDTVRDVGFGEFFPPTDFQEEKMIHLGGNDGKFNSMS